RIVALCTPVHLTLSLYERGLPMDDAFARRDSKWNELAALVDETHWHCHGVAGSELQLHVRRIHDGLRAEPMPVGAEEDVPPAPAQEYTIRRFAPCDAAAVGRAFYLTYGYAYDLSAVYSPQRLVELNESGSYLSIVAVAADGEIVGHYALAREGDA